MPMLWRRIAWFTSFAIAVALAVWMQSMGFGWPARIGAASSRLDCLAVRHLAALRRLHPNAHASTHPPRVSTPYHEVLTTPPFSKASDLL
jgi:hypothetical protein